MTKEAIKSILDLKTPDEIKIELIYQILKKELAHNSYLELHRQRSEILESDFLYIKGYTKALDELLKEKIKKLNMKDIDEISNKFSSDTDSTKKFIKETKTAFLDDFEKTKKKSF